MEVFFIYILKVAVLTAAFGILYHYLLKKETFHRFNRMVLAASLLLAYILPFFVISVSWSGRKLAEDEYQKYQNTQGYEWFSGPQDSKDHIHPPDCIGGYPVVGQKDRLCRYGNRSLVGNMQSGSGQPG